MTTAFQIVEAKPYHCGQMARLLRAEHQRALARVGVSAHRELRACFDQSFMRRAWLIGGRLAALGGITGTLLAPYGVVWLAMTDEAACFPLAVVREARKQLEEAMRCKAELATTVILGDEAAERLAVFLGFHVSHNGAGEPAHSRFGRRALMRHLSENVDIRVPVGAGYAIPMGYHYEEAV